MRWTTTMHESVILMKAVGDNVLSIPLHQPVDLRAPCLQGAEQFFGAHIERTVMSEAVKEKEEAFDEGMNDITRLFTGSRGGIGLRSTRGRLWFHSATRLQMFQGAGSLRHLSQVLVRPTLLPHLRESSRQSLPTSWRRRCWKSRGRDAGEVLGGVAGGIGHVPEEEAWGEGDSYDK
ncbi:hypothetical protein C349_01289 [Cryptococcus neoformans var. grubii Br795]|nr:hypothetical protein C349_01289 [Cryptococcus neoformans var. grubii Br795]